MWAPIEPSCGLSSNYAVSDDATTPIRSTHGIMASTQSHAAGESGSGATHALRGLTRVLLQPPPPPPSGWCGTDVMMHLASVSELWRSQANAQVPVYFVPADACVCRGCADRHDAVAMNAQAEWLARMEGGEGCWGVKEEWRARGVGQEGHMPPSYLVPGMGFGYREYVDKIIAIASEKAQTR